MIASMIIDALNNDTYLIRTEYFEDTLPVPSRSVPFNLHYLSIDNVSLIKFPFGYSALN